MNIGVLGSGFIIPYFIEATQQVEGMHLRGLWARNAKKRAALAHHFDYDCDDLDVLLQDQDIDVIYVGLPNGLHYSYAKKALLANKSVIVEKPFVVSYLEAKELFEIGKERGLFVFEAIMTKYSQAYQKAKQQLDRIGTIKIVQANFSQYSRRYDQFKNGVILPAFNKDLAGGALMDLGVYNIHFVVGLFGEPTQVAYYPNLEKGVDTSGVLVLDYGSFKAVCVNGKDCRSDSFVNVQAEKGNLICRSSASRCSCFDLVIQNEIVETWKAKNDAEMGGMVAELVEFSQMYQEQDFKRCNQYAQETLQVQQVLEKALQFAGLDYQSQK